ncbi:MAG TPA: L-aspartate oxidase [Candidatus Poseidoniales archaeon]|jgi:L-aspartate oxidase|nr:MAG TPA: L-aspartate oxidase [Candidatus Poseidoniales archaeon]HIH57950.1 L-aspartate oxidase [Candidatus Poseidoniaceae archaeon]|tara:strand:+ start:3672 stop:5252 length:1581 start_codon:yes stop_codon:yes gene_type:complete
MSRVVIIGSGIAGLFAALKLEKAGHEVIIITKQRPEDSSTNWAQGGIAGILDKTDGKGMEEHIADTLSSGDGLCNEEIVRCVVEEAGDRIRDLLAAGVEFEKEGEDFHYVQEGGHTSRRILHAKDATGAEIERALNQAVSDRANISMRPHTLGVDLIQRSHGNPEQGVKGIWCLSLDNGEMEAVAADAILIATGGCGQLWERTTNPSVATGDGLAMAVRAGAASKDMAFFQFHPTALMADNKKPFLITEALRGEGGILLDNSGLEKYRNSDKGPERYSFTLDFSPQGSLATRDVVARGCDQKMKISGADNVWLVTDHLDSAKLHDHFPTIESRLNELGLSLGRDALPVAPAAHYMVGGLEVDIEGRVLMSNGKAMPGLYAIGEVACTGMHGANRLASNSLLEAVVFANKASEHFIANSIQNLEQVPGWRAEGMQTLVEHAPLVRDLETLRKTMTDDVGIVRSFDRLERARRMLNLLSSEVDLIWRKSTPTRELVELRNLVLVATHITEDALARTENRGLHWNKDLI